MLRRCLGCGRRTRGSRCPACYARQKAPYSDPVYVRNREVALRRDGFTCQMVRNGRKCCRFATTANHRVPLSKGGSNAVANLEAACLACNSGKRDR
jgi:5-methylcytosine-specific restriction endonuclease McrA